MIQSLHLSDGRRACRCLSCIHGVNARRRTLDLVFITAIAGEDLILEGGVLPLFFPYMAFDLREHRTLSSA